MTIDLKEKSLKVSLYSFMHALWNMNKKNFTENENKCIEIAFSYNTEYNEDFTELAERLYKGEKIANINMKVSRPVIQEHKESFRDGYLLILKMYAVNFLSPSKRDYEKSGDPDIVNKYPRFIPNSLAAKNKAIGVNIDAIGKYEMNIIVYLFNVMLKDTSKYLNNGMPVKINWSHIIKTQNLTKNRNAKSLLIKASETLLNTKININISKDTHIPVCIVEGEFQNDNNKLVGLRLHPDFNKTGIEKYVKYEKVTELINSTNSQEIIVMCFKLIDISAVNSRFKQSVDTLAKMFGHDISTKNKKQAFKDRQLKKALEILKKLGTIKTYKLDSKEVVISFQKDKELK